MSELPAQIAANLAYWSDVGPAVVRRDSELAQEVAARDLRQEARIADYDLYRRKCREVAAMGRPAAASPAPSAVSPEKIREMDWLRDRGYFGCPGEAAEISQEDRAFALSADGDYLATCLEKTGDTIAEAENEKRSAQSAELLLMTAKIAEKMEAAGFACHRDTPFELYRYFVHSRQIERLPNYRRIVFLPIVAQMVRAPVLSALEFWLSRHPFARFWTFTSGPRVELSGVRERAIWLHDKISELNAQPFMRAAGVRLVFRSTELGTIETSSGGKEPNGGRIERENGRLFFHVHAHCVVHMSGGWIPPEKWAELLRQVHAFFPFVFLEGKIIRSARECCKYLTKPGELLALSGEDLVALQAQLSRLKLVQPMGSLAVEIAAREKVGQRLVRRKTPDGRVYVVVKNWNRHARRTDIEKSQDAAQRLTAKPARGLVRIASRGVPRFGKSGVAEPVAVLMAMRGSLLDAAGMLRPAAEKAIRGHVLIRDVIRATAGKYAAGVVKRAAVLRIKVHTRTPTSGPDLATPETWRLSGLKKHGPGAERSGF